MYTAEPKDCRNAFPHGNGKYIFSTGRSSADGYEFARRRSSSFSWCVLVKTVNNHASGCVRVLGPCGLGLLREGVSIWLRLLRAIAKVKYLQVSVECGIVPLHLLNNLVKLENSFNKIFLGYYKDTQVFDMFGYQLVKLDIKQSHWLVRTCRNKLLSFVNKCKSNWPKVTVELEKIICKFENSFLNVIMTNCYAKARRKYRGKVCNPYCKNKNNNEYQSTIMSNNLCVNHGKSINTTVKDYFSKYINLKTEGRVINVSGKDIPPKVTRVLSLGETFNLPCDFNNKVIRNRMIRSTIADTEAIIDTLETNDECKNGLRNLSNDVFNSFIREGGRNKKDRLANIITNDIKFLRSYFKQNKDLKIIKADKTKQLVIITSTQYSNKIMALLNDKKTYRTIRENPGPSLSLNFKKYVDRLVKYKFITKEKCKELNNPYFREPRIRGLIKTHKNGAPLRPIIDGRDSPVCSLSKMFCNILNRYRKVNSKYDVESGLDVKKKCKELGQLKEGMVIVSFDAVALFTNTPVNIVVEIIKNKWLDISHHSCIKSRAVFLEGFKLCVENGFFKYQDIYYRQLFGVPMGGCLSVAVWIMC